MTDDLDRALAAIAFDDEVDAVRPGWEQDGEAHGSLAGAEVWTRCAAGLTAVVTGCWAGSDTGAGYWVFIVHEGLKILTQGESSRRGWAMDGADGAFPTVN